MGLGLFGPWKTEARNQKLEPETGTRSQKLGCELAGTWPTALARRPQPGDQRAYVAALRATDSLPNTPNELIYLTSARALPVS